MRGVVLAIAALFASATPAQARAPGLNHVYIVLDQPTFDAIRTSPQITVLLGRSDGGLPDHASPAADTDRIFFRGRQTYLELFAPDNRFGEPVGKIGIGIGEDRPDRFERLAGRWRTACGSGFSRASVAWTRTTPPVPWYDSIQCDATATPRSLAVWAMVYRPEFHRWQTGDRSAVPETSRRAILEPRKASGQGRFDLAEVEIAVPARLRDSLVRQFQSAGFARRDTPTTTFLRGNEWIFVVRSAGDEATLSSIVVRTETRLPQPLSLGSVHLLRCGGRYTRLLFKPSTALSPLVAPLEGRRRQDDRLHDRIFFSSC